MNDITSVIEITLGNYTHSKLYDLGYSGSCPWCGGTNHFHVLPYRGNDIPNVGNLGRFQGISSEQGQVGCGRKGDMISYVQQRRDLSFKIACKELGIDPLTTINYRREMKGLTPAKQLMPLCQRQKVLSETCEAWKTNAYNLTHWASS